MAIINIGSDSDGTLHSASLHNDKFAVVQNVVNGNIEHANLKYPNSVVEWSADSWVIYNAGPTYDGSNKARVSGFHDADSVGLVGDGASYNDAASQSNYFMNSLRKTDRAYKILMVKAFWQSRPFSGMIAGFQLFLEYASSNSVTLGDWTQISTTTVTQPSATSVMEEVTPGSMPLAVPADKYFRVRLGQGAAFVAPGNGPDLPEMHVKILLATQHVA